MGKRAEANKIEPTPATSAGRRSFRANGTDLAERINEMEAGLAEARANIQAISVLVDKISRG